MPASPGPRIEEGPGGPRPIEPAGTSVAAFVGTAARGPVDRAVRLGSFAAFGRAFGGLEPRSELGFAVRQFFANGGTRALAVRLAEGRDWRPGLAALGQAEPWHLLALPGVFDPAALADAAGICQVRRAFLLVDPPGPALGPASAGRGLPRVDQAAAYFPWVVIDDPLRPGTTRICPPSGSVAGLYARVDAASGVWATPAGLGSPLVGVRGLARSTRSRDIEVLTRAGVNSLRLLPDSRTVAWGARTLGTDGTPEYRFIAARRTGLFLEESLVRGLAWAVFEPNTEPTWAAIRASVGRFLDGLASRGAFAGATPDRSFFVRCDATTTTQADVDAGRLHVVVGFAPLRPAEFVSIRIVLAAGGGPDKTALRAARCR